MTGVSVSTSVGYAGVADDITLAIRPASRTLETNLPTKPTPAGPHLSLEPPALESLGRALHLTGGAVLVLLAAIAWLLGCQELFDGDVWWHVRAGQWIRDNHQVPTLDPFTFASADRSWIDLHWLFQVILAAVYAAGGVRGIILMAAAVSTAVLLIGLTARVRPCPSWVAAACWLPALVAMSARLVPRPELFSYLAMALYLAVLFRTDDRPALAWALPIVQVVWVNAHSLFVLGPIILGSYLLSRLVEPRNRRAVASDGRTRQGWRWWWHVGGAAAAVALACMANPYGLRGALFPLELFPKITAWGGPYKALIEEFLDLRAYIQSRGLPVLGSLYTRIECALLWALPLSFLVPAAWRSWTARRIDGSRLVESVAWICAFALAASLILVCALGLPGPGSPRGLVRPARLAAPGMAVLGITGAALLVRRSRYAALLAAVGGLAEAAWVAWLKAHLEGPAPGLSVWIGAPDSYALGWAAALLGCAAALLTLRAGGRAPVFRMLLAGLFSYLALQAVRNIGLFGLAAGFVLAWNLGEWTVELAAARSGPLFGPTAGLASRVVLAGVAGLVIFTVVSGRFFRATGEKRQFGLREMPLAYAHDAARFAGRPGLPDRALVFGLRQAAVYLFHNGPGRKLFMDGRLEVPSRSTFETYVRLNRLLADGKQGWSEPLRGMGEIVIVLDHEENFGAEATLLVNPDGRCIYYDAVASVFVSRRRRDLDLSFPSVDFAARHFCDRAWRAAPPRTLGVGEAKALLNLGSAVRQRAGAPWSLRASLALLAGDRLRQALVRDPTAVAEWALLGNSFWSMTPDLTAVMPSPNERWDPARGLLPAQAVFCYRRALELDPGHISSLSLLLQAYRAQRMYDVQGPLTARLRRAWTAEVGDTGPAGDADSIGPPAEPGGDPASEWDRDVRTGFSGAIADLLELGRPEGAVRLFTKSESRGIAPVWWTCDRVAVTLLHLGRPAEARQLWERAADPPTPSLRLTRIATAQLAALDFEAARRTYQSALVLDRALGEAWFGLALLHTQLGEAEHALAAAREGLRSPVTPPQAAFLEKVSALVVSLLGTGESAVRD